ncbi:MAG: hypothetical protein HY718_12415, partial [Planctomycetes bacterium]|nr:hypothetical protein [Planctomycetota bacterium]
LPGLVGQLNLSTGRLTVDARTFSATLGGLLHIQATGAHLTVDPHAPDDAELLRIDNAVATLDALTAGGLTPTVDFDTFGLRQDGRFFLSGAELRLPAGYTNALGIAGFIPLELQSLRIDFPDPDDLNVFVLGVTGRFLIDELDNLLPFTPIIHIGDPDQIGQAGDGVRSIGPGDNGTFDFDLDVLSLRDGVIAPRNFGPITLGIQGLQVGTVRFDGQVTLGGYQDGEFQDDLAGFLRIVASDDAGSLNSLLEILPTSTLAIDETGARLDLDAELTVNGGGGQGATLRFGLLIDATRQAAPPFVRIDRFEPSFERLAINIIVIDIGDFLRFTARDVVFTPNPGPGQPIATLGNVLVEFLTFPALTTGTIDNLKLFDDPAVEGDRRVEIGTLALDVSGVAINADPVLLEVNHLQLATHDLVVNLETGFFNADGIELNADVAIHLGEFLTLRSAAQIDFDAGPNELAVQFAQIGVEFNDDFPVFNGWGASAGNIGVRRDGTIVALPAFFIDIAFPEDTLFGLPAWVPLHVTRAGIRFPNQGDPDEEFVIENPADFRVVFDADFGGKGIPFEAGVTGLEVDLGILTGQRPGFPITNLDAISFGVTEPLILGPVTVAGGFKIGFTPVEKNFYLDIRGLFGLEGLGDMGARLLIGEFGPIAGELIVPTPIPLGPTGLVLSSISGGLVFGQEPGEFNDASEITRSDIPGLPGGIGNVTTLVDAAANDGVDLWVQPVT